MVRSFGWRGLSVHRQRPCRARHRNHHDTPRSFARRNASHIDAGLDIDDRDIETLNRTVVKM